MGGRANIKPEWVPNQKDPNHNIGEGGRGICCSELDLWEANKFATQQALHTADETGQIVCEGLEVALRQKDSVTRAQQIAMAAGSTHTPWATRNSMVQALIMISTPTSLLPSSLNSER